MFRDIGIQWVPLDNIENSKLSTDSPDNTDQILYREIFSLKADNCSLKLSLADSLQCSNNLQVSITVLTNTIQEKYELIEEINNLHKLNKKLQNELSCEREAFRVEKRNFLNEMYELKEELETKRNSMAVLNTQSVELKKSLYKAQETIHRMGNMFLKLKSMKKL
ncbi:hypothetical protein Bhyg_11338 [Pseudolycoriella hygida]|uniref:Uncharacterized protein n=1 Tax=Pseudolycoriella hygida TaxID=35572 RepID=A0A9Q0MVD5_9DIPT|nr:hypothetical protein Bhyg_11338 [Pseudolycoriella hygida]